MNRSQLAIAIVCALACHDGASPATRGVLPTEAHTSRGPDALVGRLSYLPIPGGLSGVTAVAVNDAGWITGSGFDHSGCQRVVLWTPRRSVEILPFCGAPVDINGRTQIAGTLTVGGVERAFLWTPGSGPRDLGSLNGTWSRAAALNDSGWVVGTSGQGGVQQTAFVYTPALGMRDLSALAGTAVTEARAVNRRGEVLADEAPVFGTPFGSVVWAPSTGVRQLPAYQPGLFNRGKGYDMNEAGEVTGTGPYDVFNDQRTLKWPASGAPLLLSVRIRCIGSTYGSRIADNGSILGSRWDCGDSGPAEFLWTSEAGAHFLTGYTSCTASDLTPSGRRAVGTCPSGPAVWDF